MGELWESIVIQKYLISLSATDIVVHYVILLGIAPCYNGT